MINNLKNISLDKKPIWYLFALANITIVLGCAITWGIILSKDTQNYYLPTIICNLLSIIFVIIFLWIESKNTMPKIVHFQKKWLWWYLVSIIVFISAIIFDFLFFYLSIDMKMVNVNELIKKSGWPFWTNLLIVSFLTLLSIGLQRYAKFRIDLDMYRRMHGQNPKDLEKKNQKNKATSKKGSSASTSGLLDEINKKNGK